MGQRLGFCDQDTFEDCRLSALMDILLPDVVVVPSPSQMFMVADFIISVKLVTDV